MKDNDSDNDEGFVPTKVQIKADQKTLKNNRQDHQSNRPTDFQGRYIFGDGLMRKQPTQLYHRFANYLPQIQDNGHQSELIHSKQQQKPQESKININKTKVINKNKEINQKKSSKKTNKFNSDFVQPQNLQAQTNVPLTPNLNQKCQLPGHPYQKFISNQNYTLVYSRYKDRIHTITSQSDDFSTNQINLTKVLTKYDPDHYSVLKPFEYLHFGNFRNRKTTKQYHNLPIKSQFIIEEATHNNHLKKNITSEFDNNRHTTRQNHENIIRIHSQINNSHTHITPHINHQISSAQHSTIGGNHQSHNHHDHISHSYHSQNHHQSQITQQLQFDSKFQCGNLLYAFKSKKIQNNYILFLQNDTNSYGYNQWFYFSLRNMKARVPYKFTIINFRKKHSLFKQGMKISVFSLIQAQKNNSIGRCGWRKMGNNIKYQKSIIKKHSDKKFKFYSLSFELTFDHEGDYIKVAMNIPYSYSRLIYHLKICQQVVKQNNKQQEHEKQKNNNTSTVENSKYSKQTYKVNQKINNETKNDIYWQLSPVGYTISNNAVPYLTVTNMKNIEKEQQSPQTRTKSENSETQSMKKKKAIIIISRQHPGQTWSSFMMQQILYLLAQNKNDKIKWLLQNYTFKIFPMVNIDGVIYGNFRCDLGGFDLNRNWRNPDKNLHPQVFSIKSQIQKIATQYKIQCVLDLHGHSKQYNTFSYACKNDPITSRVLSMIISQLNSFFHFPYCTFGLSKYKETTARAVIYKLTGNQNILTIQNSFYAGKIGDKITVYDPSVFKSLSQSIIQGIFQYMSQSILRKECEEKIKQNIQEYLQYQRAGECPAAADSGSESEPYVDQISIKDKIKKILPKFFKSIQDELEQQQKIIRKKHKKKEGEKKPSSINRDYKTINPSAPKKTRAGKQQQNEQQAQTFIQRTSLTYYKRNSKQLPKKTPEIDHLNQTNGIGRISIEQNNSVVRTDLIGKVGQVGLPFYIREKATLVPIKLKNDSLQIFKDAYNATRNTQNESALNKYGMKPSYKKVKIINSIHNEISDQFPLLCVLSQEKKKQSLLQKTHGLLNEKQKISSSLPPKARTYVQNEKLESIKKSNRAKNSSLNQNNVNGVLTNQRTKQIEEGKIIKNKGKETSIISKIWRQNFARYGKDLNVFFGGIRP